MFEECLVSDCDFLKLGSVCELISKSVGGILINFVFFGVSW